MPYYKARVCDRKTGREFVLRVNARTQSTAEARLYWLGFLIASIQETSGPKPDPLIKSSGHRSSSYDGTDVGLGEVFDASTAFANGERSLSRLLSAAELEWSRPEDRHFLLTALIRALRDAGDNRLEVAGWQWMAELPEIKEGLRRGMDEPVSPENVVGIDAAAFLSDCLRAKGDEHRAAELGLLVAEALRGGSFMRSVKAEKLRAEWIVLSLRTDGENGETEAAMEKIEEALGYGPVAF